MSPREIGLPCGGELLRVSHKDAIANIPVASSFVELQNAVSKAVVPCLQDLNTRRKPGQLIDVGFVSYVYYTDRFEFVNPEAATALVQALRKAGLEVPDTPKKLDPIAPSRHSFISEMRRSGGYYYKLRDFSNGTFIIGPIVVEPIDRIPGIYDYVAEVEASTLHMSSSVAVHGATLLADVALDENRDRIFNSEIVEIIDRVFYPYDLPIINIP